MTVTTTGTIPGNTGRRLPEVVTTQPVRRLVVILTCLGLVPFAALALFAAEPLVLQLFKGYSLAIIAFLCGSWWSTALITPGVTSSHRVQILLVSNGLTLIAVGFAVVNQPVTLLLMAALFAIQAFVERSHLAFAKQPHYYRRLRLGVSLVALGLHAVAYLMIQRY